MEPWPRWRNNLAHMSWRSRRPKCWACVWETEGLVGCPTSQWTVYLCLYAILWFDGIWVWPSDVVQDFVLFCWSPGALGWKGGEEGLRQGRREAGTIYAKQINITGRKLEIKIWIKFWINMCITFNSMFQSAIFWSLRSKWARVWISFFQEAQLPFHLQPSGGDARHSAGNQAVLFESCSKNHNQPVYMLISVHMLYTVYRCVHSFMLIHFVQSIFCISVVLIVTLVGKLYVFFMLMPPALTPVIAWLGFLWQVGYLMRDQYKIMDSVLGLQVRQTDDVLLHGSHLWRPRMRARRAKASARDASCWWPIGSLIWQTGRHMTIESWLEVSSMKVDYSGHLMTFVT